MSLFAAAMQLADRKAALGPAMVEAINSGEADPLETMALLANGMDLDPAEVKRVLDLVAVHVASIVVMGITPSSAASGCWYDGLLTGIIYEQNRHGQAS